MRATLADDLSRMGVNEVKENFRRQGYVNAGDVFIPWRATKTKKAAKLGGKRGSGILVQSGALKRSIRKGGNFDLVRVYTDIPYAEIHNNGGKVSGTWRIGAHVRKIKSGKFVPVQSHSRTVNFTMPRRQFINTPYLNKMAMREYDKRLLRIMKQQL